MKRIFIALFFVLFLVIGGVLLSNPNTSNSNKLKVLATTTQLYDFTKNIAKDNVDLTLLFQPNIDPHEYDPTAQDIKKIEDSQIIFINGAGLETKVQKNLNDSGSVIINASDSAMLLTEDGSIDPHIWFSVQNVKSITETIAETLSAADSDHKDEYMKNAEEYIGKLNDLDFYIKNKVSELAINDRKLVTNHDAFGYYINEYGFTFVGSVVPGLSSDSQPSAQETTDLITKIKAENVKAIFTESSINPKLAEEIAKEANIKIIDNLYGDTLGRSESNSSTYISMMKYNTDTIVNNLK